MLILYFLHTESHGWLNKEDVDLDCLDIESLGWLLYLNKDDTTQAWRAMDIQCILT